MNSQQLESSLNELNTAFSNWNTTISELIIKYGNERIFSSYGPSKAFAEWVKNIELSLMNDIKGDIHNIKIKVDNALQSDILETVPHLWDNELTGGDYCFIVGNNNSIPVGAYNCGIIGAGIHLTKDNIIKDAFIWVVPKSVYFLRNATTGMVSLIS